MSRSSTILGLPVVLWIACSAAGEERVALVIGNSKYEGEAALRNPANDSAALEAALKKLDFQVVKKNDLDLAELDDAVVEFRRSLKKRSVALFFYAGHGVQVKGENYFVPLRAELREEFQVKQKCYKIDHLLAALDESEAALKIVILDCCRDNPFTRGWTRGAAAGGLASISDVPTGTIIAFSTAPGKTALDGRGANSPYTAHLVAGLTKRPAEGLEITAVLRAASRAVKQETGQIPWLNLEASLDEYYLWRDASAATGTSRTERTEAPPVMPPTTNVKTMKNGVGMSLVLVPPGEFVMGAAPFDLAAEDDEAPRHRVKISQPFYLGMYEVTKAQFAEFAANRFKTSAETDPKGSNGTDGAGDTYFEAEFNWRTPGFVQEDTHPAVHISWSDANSYCEWLSRREGRKYRLPTEAEWEYACRAGRSEAYLYEFGSDPAELASVGNVADQTAKDKFQGWSAIAARDGYLFTAPVGQFKPNPFGLYDLTGNVAEWCDDAYDAASYAGRGALTHDPRVFVTPKFYVHRGGSWTSKAALCRVSRRGGGNAHYSHYGIGFRVCTSGEVSSGRAVSATKPREEMTNSLGMKLIRVPPGDFVMGLSESEEKLSAAFPGQEKDFTKGERPAFNVRISEPFWMGACEVTLGQFLKFYHEAKYKTDAEKDGEGGWGYQAGTEAEFRRSREFVPWTTGFKQTMEHPVVNVSWNDAQAFCTWLSRKEGYTYRLPTEAEWEYGCRAGTTTRFGVGNDPEKLAGVDNIADAAAKRTFTSGTNVAANDGYAFTAPVGSFPANAFGLHDMHGNVSEWCLDWHVLYEEAGGVMRIDPRGPGHPQEYRSRRGGSFLVEPVDCRASCRAGMTPNDRRIMTGFRVVLCKP